MILWCFNRCATTHRQTTDRKSTRRQKLTDKKIFTDTTTERQRQVADTTTHRQKPIIFLYKTGYHSQLRLHLSLKLMYNVFFVHFAGTFWLSIFKNGDWFFVHPIPEGQKQISF